MSAGAMERSPAPPLRAPCARWACSTAEGASLGLAPGSCARAAACPATSTATRCRRGARKFVVVKLLGGAVLAAGPAALWIWRRAGRPRPVERISRRLAPLCLAAFVPLLFHWQLLDRPARADLPGAWSAAFGLTLQALMRVALEAPPMLPARRAARRRRAGADSPTRLRARPGCRPRSSCSRVLAPRDLLLDHHDPEPLRLQTSGYDLGIENNLVWNAAHCNAPLFKTSVMGGPVRDAHRLHETYISYLIGIPYRLAPRPESLLVLQALLIGAAALPLFAVRAPPPGRVDACLSRACCSCFTRRCTARTCTTFTTCRSRRSSSGRRWRCSRRAAIAGPAVAVVLTLANREDMSALLIVVGLFLLLTGERPRAGLVVAGDRRRLLRRREVHPHAALPGRRDRLRPPVQGPGPRGRARLRRRPQDRPRQPRLHGSRRARHGQGPLPAADHGAARVLPVAPPDRPALLAARLLLHDAGDAVPARSRGSASSTPPTGPASSSSPSSRTCAG